MSDDAQLIEEALAGKSAAFELLVRKYQDRLYNTLIHVTGSAEEARDVVQDAFVQVFLKLETFRGNSAFFTWLYRIAFNLAVGRKRRHRPKLAADHGREGPAEEPLARDPPPLERLAQRERAEQVRSALALLGEEHRAVLVLREIEGCDYETIAKMLDLPVGTVRSRLHRARSALRELLSEVEPGHERDTPRRAAQRLP